MMGEQRVPIKFTDYGWCHEHISEGWKGVLAIVSECCWTLLGEGTTVSPSILTVLVIYCIAELQDEERSVKLQVHFLPAENMFPLTKEQHQ